MLVFGFAQNAIQIVRMIKMIGAMTVVVPRNFIATLFIGESNARFGFHRFLVALPPARVLLLGAKHLFVAAKKGASLNNSPVSKQGRGQKISEGDQILRARLGCRKMAVKSNI